jgi:tRNA G26 N,N-dimethylase Trm1
MQGLLCVTCTDLAVLATTNYPEKWYAITVYILTRCPERFFPASQITVVYLSKLNMGMKL